MIGSCREYLEEHLKSLGIMRVYTRAEDAAKHQALPYAVVMIDGQTAQRDGSLVARADGPGPDERTLRRRLYRRTVKVLVTIVHRDRAAADAAGEAFLSGLTRRIFDTGGNAILVAAQGAEPEEEASLLKPRETAHILVVFEGGIYADQVVKVYDLETSLQVEGEISQEV